MSKPLRIDAEAEEELSAAALWYQSQRPGLGHELLDAVDDALRRIEANPGAWALATGVSHELAVRRCLVHRFPYSVFFLELEGEIRVIAIAHQRKRPGYWRDRLR